jgi:hypothetical protein
LWLNYHFKNFRWISFLRNQFFVALSFRPSPSNKMGGADRCGISFYAGNTTTDTGLLLVAPAPQLFKSFLRTQLLL